MIIIYCLPFVSFPLISISDLAFGGHLSSLNKTKERSSTLLRIEASVTNFTEFIITHNISFNFYCKLYSPTFANTEQNFFFPIFIIFFFFTFLLHYCHRKQLFYFVKCHRMELKRPINLICISLRYKNVKHTLARKKRTSSSDE